MDLHDTSNTHNGAGIKFKISSEDSLYCNSRGQQLLSSFGEELCTGHRLDDDLRCGFVGDNGEEEEDDDDAVVASVVCFESSFVAPMLFVGLLAFFISRSFVGMAFVVTDSASTFFRDSSSSSTSDNSNDFDEPSNPSNDPVEDDD